MKIQEVNKIRHNGGFAYLARTQKLGLGSAIMLEDGVPLPGAARASHDSIRNLGMGRYSFWYGEVYFSASDNSDPRTNGRSYSFRYDENEITRLGILLFPLHWILKLFPQSVFFGPLKKFSGLGQILGSLRRLKFSFFFWSSFYWLSFLYVISQPKDGQR